jgi:hypothetical protein
MRAFRPLAPVLQESSTPSSVRRSTQARLAALVWLPVAVVLSWQPEKLVLAEADLRASQLLLGASELLWVPPASVSLQAQTELPHWVLALGPVRLESRNCQ